MDPKGHYQYTALTEPDAIRLIVLQPSADLEAQVQCDLIHTTLTECNNDIADQYTAISYVWGDTTDTVPVSVNRRAFDITASLNSALRHVRDRCRPLRLWADALCINQRDSLERNQQVRQMASIYAVAQHTVIYLGEADPEYDCDLNAMKRRLVQFDNYQKPLRQMADESLEKDPGVAARLAQRPWFTRIWVLQELVFSKDPWIQCGTVRFRWDNFCCITVRGPWRPKEEYRLLSEMAGARSSHHNRTDARAARGTYDTLLQVLQSRRGLGVSDPRDMLFAHAGIIANSNVGNTEPPSSLRVDYRKSCNEVYQDITRFMMETCSTYEPFGALSSVEDIDMDMRRPGLASWATDWTCPKQNTALDLKPYLTPNPVIFEDFFERGSASYSSFKASHAWVSQDGISSPTILAFFGHHVGVVQSFSPVVSWSEASFSIYEETHKHRVKSKRMKSEEADQVDEVWEYTKNACTEVLEKWRYKLGDMIFPDGMINEISRLKPREPTEMPAYMASIYQGIDTLCTPSSSYNILPRLAIPSDLLTQFITRSISRRNELNGMSIFHGRRFARLRNGSLALVPASTREGDIVCAYEWSSIPLLLRREVQSQESGLDESVRLAFNSEGAKEMEVEHFKFVGECLADDCMESTGPWRRPVPAQGKVIPQVGKPLIFAMH